MLVAGFPPFMAKRFKYYEDPILAARAALPALELKPGGPYPFRPKQQPNAWIESTDGSKTAVSDAAVRASTAPVIELTLANEALGNVPEELEAELHLQHIAELDEQEQLRAQALAEHERLEQRHHKHRRIPL